MPIIFIIFYRPKHSVKTSLMIKAYSTKNNNTDNDNDKNNYILAVRRNICKYICCTKNTYVYLKKSFIFFYTTF